MDLAATFTVSRPPATVFAALLDPALMRRCLPGCEELERTDERTFRGRMQSEIAHVRFNSAFSATIVDFDPPNRLHALLQGEDRRIASSIKIDIDLHLTGRGDETDLAYTMQLSLWGRIGRLGEARGPFEAFLGDEDKGVDGGFLRVIG